MNGPSLPKRYKSKQLRRLAKKVISLDKDINKFKKATEERRVLLKELKANTYHGCLLYELEVEYLNQRSTSLIHSFIKEWLSSSYFEGVSSFSFEFLETEEGVRREIEKAEEKVRGLVGRTLKFSKQSLETEGKITGVNIYLERITEGEYDPSNKKKIVYEKALFTKERSGQY